MRRGQGRVTRDDVRSAGLRRWDGRSRVTTEWVNIFHVSSSIISSARRSSIFEALTSTSRNPSFAGRLAIASSTYANLANRVEALLFECILLSSESKVSMPWSTVAWSETPSMSIQSVSCRIALAVTLRIAPGALHPSTVRCWPGRCLQPSYHNPQFLCLAI